MRLNVSATVVVVFVYLTLLVGCDRRQTTDRESASRNNTQPAQALAQAPATNPFCTVLNDGRSSISAFMKRMNNESNPLKKASLEEERSQLQAQFMSSVETFLQDSQIDNYKGVVSAMNFQQYAGASGLWVGIDIPCNVTLSFRFLDIKNPRDAQIDPRNDTSLPLFRSVLENLAVHDLVTFSGTFSRLEQNPLGPFVIRGTITDLRKD